MCLVSTAEVLRRAGSLRAVTGVHPRAAAVEGRAPAPWLVLADGPALELRVRERGGASRVEHAGHGPAVEGVDRLFGSRAREDVANILR